ERAAQLAGDPAAQLVVDVPALGGYHEQQQLAGPAFGVLEVHHERVDDLGQPLDDRVELRGTQPYPAPVQGRVGAAGDDAGTPLGDGYPVAVPPDAGVHVEVRLAVPRAGLVAPEAHRHARHRRGDDQLAELAGDGLTPVVERLHT